MSRVNACCAAAATSVDRVEKLINLYNIDPNTSAMFDDIAKNLVPAKKVGFTPVWIDAGYENFSDDIKASKNYYVSPTDEYPLLFVIAALTKGISVFKGIEDLANKESNRIIEMQKVLKQINIKSTSTKNEIKIFGKGKIVSLTDSNEKMEVEFENKSKKTILVRYAKFDLID